MANTQVEGTIHLPDGRLLPVLLSLDLSALPTADSTSDNPLFGRAVEVFGSVEKRGIGWTRPMSNWKIKPLVLRLSRRKVNLKF